MPTHEDDEIPWVLSTTEDITRPYPPAPTWTPPPPPSSEPRKGKGIWRPSGPPPTPALITPPSTPMDDEMSPTSRHVDEDSLPTFAQSQEQYGHTNPLLAHPVQQPSDHAPPEKMPLDQYYQGRDSYIAHVPPHMPRPVPQITYTPENRAGCSTDSPAPSVVTTAVSGPSSPKDTATQKPGWFTQLGHKTTHQINNLAHKYGGTGFLPDTLDKECDKASLILRTFCKRGIYADTSKPADQQTHSPDGHSPETQKISKALVTIPPMVISKAVGLAIFTSFRAALNFRGATGSGILVSRQHNGSWSPPSAIHLTSVGGGFVGGLDVYDCVCVINSQEALSAFMDTRVSIGSDISVCAGPWGVGGSVEWGAPMDRRFDHAHGERRPSATDDSPPSPPVLEVNGEPVKISKETKTRARNGSRPKKYSPVFSYVKSRGFYAGVGYEGTIVTERKEANAAFYGDKVSCEQILRGQASAPENNVPLQNLFDTLRCAEGGQLGPADDGSVAEDEAPAEPQPPPPPPDIPTDSLHPIAAYFPEKR